MTLTVRHYRPDLDQQRWDAFVSGESRNATFLHLRDYMDYHSDRFTDASLMVEDDGRLLAVMPGCSTPDDTFSTHSGLTFGGLLMSDKITQESVLEAFRQINALLRSEGYKNVIYKPVPHIYHRIPAEDDLYALFKECGATLAARAPSATIITGKRPPLSRDRKYSLNKATKSGVTASESDDYTAFWEILTGNLSRRHNALPVHSLDEIRLLQSRFPERIKLHTAKSATGEIVAGCVVYLFDRVAHTQYISASAEGFELRALDLLLNHIIEQYSDFQYFDFGISTEQGGMILNSGLMHQKEGFGARATVLDTYTYSL